MKTNMDKKLDPEWLQLVEDLIEANISKDEFKNFLEFKKEEMEKKEKKENHLTLQK